MTCMRIRTSVYGVGVYGFNNNDDDLESSHHTTITSSIGGCAREGNRWETRRIPRSD